MQRSIGTGVRTRYRLQVSRAAVRVEVFYSFCRWPYGRNGKAFDPACRNAATEMIGQYWFPSEVAMLTCMHWECPLRSPSLFSLLAAAAAAAAVLSAELQWHLL